MSSKPQESRTSKSIKNARVNVFYFFVQIILGFWARKVFYDYLGSEVLGLDTTATSLLNFLNIAESGVGSAVAFFLYSPLYENDTLTINKIVSLQRWIYRRIATLILCGALVLMLFFPTIFSDIQIPLWYAYATFLVLLAGNLIGYYLNYRQSVLFADQKGYKVTRVTQLSSVLLKLLLIVLLPYVPHPFLFYIGTTFVGYLWSCFWINRTLKQEYPWLETVSDGRTLTKEFPDVLKKTKQLFVHKIAAFVVMQCSPLIMYSCTSLTIISYYGNYLLVIDKISVLLNRAFSSTDSAIGNLIASQDKERTISVFWELIDSRMCISTALLFVCSLVTEPFISLWLSPSFLLGKPILYLVLASAWMAINRTTVVGFKCGYGIFNDVWAPIAESAINLVVSLIGGYYWGISGVLLGGIVSYLIIVYGWQPYNVFHDGFQIDSLRNYFLPYGGRLLLISSLILMLTAINRVIDFQITNLSSFIAYIFGVTLVSIPTFYLAFLGCTPGMKAFQQRLFAYLRK